MTGSKVSTMETDESNRSNTMNTENRKSKCCHSPFKYCLKILGTLFERLGGVIAQYPWLVIVLCLLVAGGLSVGLMKLKVESRTDKLFIPQESQALKDIDRGIMHFHDVDTREEAIILVPKSERNTFSSKCLAEALKIHKAVVGLESFTRYCATKSGLAATSISECMSINFLEIFSYNENNMINIDDKLTRIQNSSEVMSNGRSVSYNFGRMFGKIQTNTSTGKITGADALQIIYFMQNPKNDEDNLKLVEWEKTFINSVKPFKNNLTCFTVNYAAERSLDDAISESSGSDIILISITFTIMISFSSIMLGKFTNPLMGHSLLANAGVFAVALGVVAGFGFCLLCGSTFVSLIGVLPFLILGIGIDDMFILVDELDRQETHLTVVQTVKLIMSNSGATITMTTITDLVAFAVSTSTAFPAIRYFCTFAAVSITMSYIFIVTYFVAVMTFDIRRMKAGRRDCLPLCRLSDTAPNQSPWYQPQTSQLSNRAMKAWGRLLMRTPTKAIVVFISFGFLAAGILGVLNIQEEFNRTILAKDGSYFKNFINAQEKYFSSGMEISVVLDSTDVPYNDHDIQNDILKLSQTITENTHYKNETLSWLADLRSFVQIANDSRRSQQVRPPILNVTYLVVYQGNASVFYNETAIREVFVKTIMTSLNITNSRVILKQVSLDPLNVTFVVVDAWQKNITAQLHSAMANQKLNLQLNLINLTAKSLEEISGYQIQQVNSNLKAISLSGSNFMSTLKTFLQIPMFSHHKANVKLSKDNNSIAASRVMVFMKSSTSSIFQRDAMLSIRQDISSKSSLPAYPVAKQFKFFEQYAITLDETIRNLAIAAATILLITWPFLVDVRATLLVFLGFVALVMELFGLMYIWGVTLNSVSMINLVMAIGFSVDYSAHLAHAFVTSQEETPEQRVEFALQTLGASVLMGGVSTFLGMVVTAFASSEIFRIFFRMFFGIVVLGLVHGLCFLPVYLSIVCRWTVDSNTGTSKRSVVGEVNPGCSSDTDPGSDRKYARGQDMELAQTSARPTQDTPA